MANSEAFTGHVRGNVQGVFFRASAQEKARELGLTGWVRNAEDGSVEFLVAGEPEALEAMRHWLHEGPGRASVSAVNWQSCSDPGMKDFQIRA